MVTIKMKAILPTVMRDGGVASGFEAKR